MLVRCIAIALGWLSLLVPEAGERARWRARWADSLGDYTLWLGSRGFSRDETRRRLLGYLGDGATEALKARWPDSSPFDAWRRRLRRPWAALALPVCLLLAGLWWSDGAAYLRTALRPLSPLQNQDRLVTAVPGRSFFGKNLGLSWRQYQLLAERATSYATLSGFATRRIDVSEPDGAVRMRRVTYATPGLFPALGLPPGEAFAAEQLGPGWVGRTIEAAGRKHRITGVWPSHLRPALARPDFWIAQAPAGFDITMVAVLKPGITAAAATRELREILLSAPRRPGSGTPTDVAAFQHSQYAILRSLAIGFGVVTAALVLFAGYRAARLKTWRMELFFLAKALPLTTGLFCGTVAGLAIPAAGTMAGPFFVLWLAGLCFVLGIWWARRDQQLRCPHCLARMTLSVQIGTHGASLLEGVGDEVLCEYGHGALWVPGAPAQAFGPEVWRDQ